MLSVFEGIPVVRWEDDRTDVIAFIKDRKVLNGQEVVEGHNKSKKGHKASEKVRITDLVMTFDTETSTVDLGEEYHAFVYKWMVSLDNEVIIYGDTLDEFVSLCNAICNIEPAKIICYVHNLPYEFQFCSAYMEFKNIFASEARKVIKCQYDPFDNDTGIEFRCSLRYSNMSLAEFSKKFCKTHVKHKGDLDYSIVRTPSTILTDEEWSYCFGDVACLVEAMYSSMKASGDDLTTVVLTSTGEVRRDFKRAMGREKMCVGDIAPTQAVYNVMQKAFRGGNTHANRFMVNRTLHDVHSYDRSSSYPDVILNKEFPVKPFTVITPKKSSLEECLKRRWPMLMTLTLINVKLKDWFLPIPYISESKCEYINPTAVIDNGRVLCADYLTLTITDIDLDIITHDYDYEIYSIDFLAYSKYGKLPKAMRDVTLDYYVKKTRLKNVKGQEIYYMKSKNKVNAVYGCTATKAVLFDNVWDEKECKWVQENRKKNDGSEYTVDELIQKAYQNSGMAYQWGVWVTAWARYALQLGLWACGDDVCYTDTDSVKYVGEHDADFRQINKDFKSASIENGAYATDPYGETHYMGVYEKETDYVRFRTLGAKRYVYTQDEGGTEKLHITVAGVSKAGAVQLDSMGGIDAFREGIVFNDGQIAHYNDNRDYGWHVVCGESVHITRNIALTPKTYELGIGADYTRIIKFFSICGEESVDNWEDMVYNFNSGRSATAHTNKKRRKDLEHDEVSDAQGKH